MKNSNILKKKGKNNLEDLMLNSILKNKDNYKHFKLYNPEKRKILDIPYSESGITTRDILVKIRTFFIGNINLKYKFSFGFFVVFFILIGLFLYFISLVFFKNNINIVNEELINEKIELFNIQKQIKLQPFKNSIIKRDIEKENIIEKK